MNKWTSQIDEVTTAFRSHFNSLDEAALNWKPDPGSWSIAQVMDHLITINRTYFPVLNALKAGTYSVPLVGKIGFMVSLMGNMVLKAVQPDEKRKIKTFPIWEPSSSALPADMLDRFTQHQEELKQQISMAEPFLEKGTVISSPANRKIVYRLETAFDIIVAHEKRHLRQSIDILESGRKSRSGPFA